MSFPGIGTLVDGLAGLLAALAPGFGNGPGALHGLVLALVQLSEYWFLPPICLAIALVSAASNREDVRTIFRHALRSWWMLMVGIAVFTLLVTTLFGWLLP